MNLCILPPIHRENSICSHMRYKLVQAQFGLAVILRTSVFRLIEPCGWDRSGWIGLYGIVVSGPSACVLRRLVWVDKGEFGSTFDYKHLGLSAGYNQNTVDNTHSFHPFRAGYAHVSTSRLIRTGNLQRRILLGSKVCLSVQISDAHIIMLRHNPLQTRQLPSYTSA